MTNLINWTIVVVIVLAGLPLAAGPLIVRSCMKRALLLAPAFLERSRKAMLIADPDIVSHLQQKLAMLPGIIPMVASGDFSFQRKTVSGDPSKLELFLESNAWAHDYLTTGGILINLGEFVHEPWKVRNWPRVIIGLLVLRFYSRNDGSVNWSSEDETEMIAEIDTGDSNLRAVFC